MLAMACLLVCVQVSGPGPYLLSSQDQSERYTCTCVCVIAYFACCVFRSRALGPYLLSSRPMENLMIHGAPALTHAYADER